MRGRRTLLNVTQFTNTNTILNVSERGAISPERDEIVGEWGAELSGAVCCDFERWSGGANTHVSGEREFSPLSSAHML